MSTELVTMPDLDPYLTPRMAGWAVQRTEKTIRSWMRRDDVATACDVETGKLLVRLRDVGALAGASGERWKRLWRVGT